MRKIRISVGIPAYNEEKNITELLNAIASQKTRIAEIEKIFVINDGSTDATEAKVKEFIKKGKLKGKLTLISLKKRKGKWFAINVFLKSAKSEILVLESADNIPKKDCIEQICLPFLDKNTGIVSSRVVPINNPDSFLGFTAQLMYELHHEISRCSPKFGELIAFRKAIKRISPTIVDEEQIASMISSLGLSRRYAPAAVVYNKGPETISDFIEQRRRIYCGHLLLKKGRGYSAPTLNSGKILILAMKHIKPENFFWVIGACLMEGYSRFLGRLDYLSGTGKRHILWKQIKSVKNLEIDQTF